MIQDVRLNWLIAMVMLIMLAATAQAEVGVETVAVGNVGNTDDTHGLGYGGVSYAYNIGKYEVTAGQYTEFLNAVAATDTHRLYNEKMWLGDSSREHMVGCKIARSGSPGTYSYSVAADWADRPVNYVSFWDAARFVNWLHNGQGSGDTESGAYVNIGDQSTFARQAGALFFIPTEDEWYKAAYHKNDGVTGNYYDYPTGSDFVPSSILIEPVDPGNNATFYYGGFTDSTYYRTEVGAHENSESPYGTFDQGGNVFEWNETVIDELYRGMRGSSYSGYARWLSAVNGTYHSPTYESYSVGFRVACRDSDGDGLTDVEKSGIGTNPYNPDTDGDGLWDGTEVDMAEGSGCPDPLNPDSDGDTIWDGDEVAEGTSPCSSDTDGDGVPDNEDPTPIDPGVPSSFIEAELRDLAGYVDLLPLLFFDAMNDNAQAGRRNALSNKFNADANAVRAGKIDDALDLLFSIFAKVDGDPKPRDWMVDSLEKDLLREDVGLLLDLLLLL